MNKKEDDGICIYGSAKELGCAIYQLLTKGMIAEVRNKKKEVN